MDPQQAQQMAVGMLGIAVVVGLILTAVMVFLYWRCLAKAGLAGALSLLVLVPGVGFFIPLCILAFSEWKVTPLAAPAYYPTSYPPPPPPPSSFPPATPPSY